MRFDLIMSLIMNTPFRFLLSASVTDEGGMGDLLESDSNDINTIRFSWFYSLFHVSLLVCCDQFNSSGIDGPGKGRDDSIGLIWIRSSCIISIHMFDSDSFRDLICFDLIRFPFQCSL